MPTLYTMPGTCSLAPNIAIAWLDAPVTIANLAYGDHRKDAYLAINPRGQVPALRFDDGDVLTEAAAILGYIGATYGTDGYARDTRLGRKEAEALSYMSSEVHAGFGPHFSVQTFAESKAAQQEVKTAAYRKLRTHFERLDAQLASAGSWYLGDRSFADTYLYVLTRWIDQTPMAIGDFPHLAEHRTRMQDDDGVQIALVRQDMRPI